MIDQDPNDDEVKFAFRAHMTTRYDMWTVRKTICYLQTGGETCDWTGDSDDEL